MIQLRGRVEIFVGTVGVFRCVFERTMSRKSFAVGTGAMALSPLVDIVGRDQRLFSPESGSHIGKLIGQALVIRRTVRHLEHPLPPAGASEVEFWRSLGEAGCRVRVLAPALTAYLMVWHAGRGRGNFWFGGNYL